MAAGNQQGRQTRGGDGGPGEAASYLKGAVAELAQLARRHRLDMLCYLLDMAYLEASEQVRLRQRQAGEAAGTDGPDGGPEDWDVRRP